MERRIANALPARKIKAELIEKAKIKKQYAKVLQKEGLSSGRLGDGPKRRGEFVKGAAAGKKAGNDDEDDNEGASGDEGGDHETDYDSDNSSILGAEGAAFAKAMRAAARGEKGADRVETGDERRQDRAGPAPGDNNRPNRRGGDFKGKGRDREHRERGDRNERGERGARRGGFTRERAPHAVAPSASAASAPGVLPAEPAVAAKDGSLRDLKKAAFGKHARAPNAKGNANVGGRKGQPNMGARMDMLLEKIRRTK